jgi:AraC family transcriptional activator of pobA
MPDVIRETIPSFFVYGEPDRPLDVGFIHVETVMARKNLHLGHVGAHKHERMAQITFWTKGRGRYFLEDESLDFSSPTVSFVPSGVVHGFDVEPEESDAIVISIADSALPPIQTLTLLPLDAPVLVNDTPDHPLWNRLFEVLVRMEEEYRDGRPGMQQILASLAATALTDIARLAAERPSPSRSGRVALSTELRRLVDRHFRDNWPVEAYVETLGSTPHLLAKACREAYGLSIKEFINQRRLLEAKRLLLFTVRSVEDIAFEIGLKDAAYFSRFFRHHVGQPPSQWRDDYARREH